MFEGNKGKREERRKYAQPYMGNEGGVAMSAEDDEYVAGLAREVKEAGREIERSQQRWNDWAGQEREKLLFNSQRSTLVPENSEERSRRIFVTSPNVVKDALDDYYENVFRPNYNMKRAEAEGAAFEAYREYASVPGADPYAAMRAMRREGDPLATLERSMQMPDDGRLDLIARRYAHYAGLDPEAYKRSVLEPAIRNRAIDEMIEERKPGSRVEYLGRSAWRNSLMGSLSDLSLRDASGVDSYRYIDDASMESYNPSRAERWAGAVGGLLLDTGAFAGIGGAARGVTGVATNVAKNRAVAGLLARESANGLTKEAAEQIVRNRMVNSLSAKIVQGSMTQGLTLGTYDAAHSVVDDLLHGNEVDMLKAGGSFGKGAATGAALGVVGTPLRTMSRGLTGGRRVAASAGVLSAESAVFTASSEMDKLVHGVEVEPIDLIYDFGESAATLLAMRMFHWSPSGGEKKLDSRGRLKEHLRFSKPEAEEIAAAGVNPMSFVTNLERSLNLYQKNSGKELESLREDYLRLMSNSELSASTRAKLLYIVENKLSSIPPVPVDYKVEERGNGEFLFTIFDGEGRAIEKIECNGEEDVRSAMFTRTGNMRRNRIAQHEKMLMQSYDSQNFFRQAGNYARETGIDVDVISDAMYRRANGEEISAAENRILEDILKRSNYGNSEVGQMLHEIRRSLEERYGLNEGSLLETVDKSVFYCSKQENAALNEYERVMESEVLKLHEGTSRERAEALATAGGRYAGMGNDEVKRLEKEDFTVRAIETGKGLNEGAIPTFTEKFGIFSDGLRKPADWNPEFVWNTYRHRHRPQDIERMSDEAFSTARKLGCDIEVIRDESEISTRDAEYTDKIRSHGWFDEVNNKIVINLPNNATIEDAKRTVVHEVVGHKGLAGIFGNYYYDFLEELYNRGSMEVRRAIEEQALRKGGSYHAGADEYLAMLTERTATTPEQRSILQRLRDFIRDTLRRLNIYSEPISESELVSLLQRHHSAIVQRKDNGRNRRSSFRPFETAHRTDGGYYNDRVAWERYNREMQSNPNLDGIAEGFHDFKRRIYGLPDNSADGQLQHRMVGDPLFEGYSYDKENGRVRSGDNSRIERGNRYISELLLGPLDEMRRYLHEGGATYE